MPMRIFAGIMRKLYFYHPQAYRRSSPAPSGHPPPGGGYGIHSMYRLCGRSMIAPTAIQRIFGQPIVLSLKCLPAAGDKTAPYAGKGVTARIIG